MKLSLFKNSFSDEPLSSISLEDFVERVRSGFWKKQVLQVREKTEARAFKRAKEALPAVTVSGEFKTRDKYTPLKERISKHTGLICLDIDKKDNLKMRAHDLIDNECVAQFVSCSGQGIKIIYHCTPTKDAAEHRRIYDAAVLRLQKKGIKLKVDPIVKSIASLQYVSYDPEAFYKPKSKLVIKPLPAPKIKKRPPSEDTKTELEQLNVYIEALGDKDVTGTYENWLNIAFGLSYSLGEHGREPFHKLSKAYPGYSEEESNEQFSACMERNVEDVGKPVTIASVFQIINEALPKVTLKQLSKKYNVGHAVGVGEDVEEGDLVGMVRYKLFLFKKIFDKEHKLIDILPAAINLNMFEALLKAKGFYRYVGKFVHIVDNIVEAVDIDDVMRIVTKHVEADGDYKFTYRSLQYDYSWEEMVHLWRTIRAQSSTRNQIASSLDHWEPNLLKDSTTESYIPYRNGVVKVTTKEIKLVTYEKIGMQIWKERILPREFKPAKSKGMFEEFFENVCGRGDTTKQRRSSESFKRAHWYFGYMLQGSKRQSTARAWLLYDIISGNNGRTGKTIIGQAVGKIRSMVTIDGKQFDPKNRFAFQVVQPWTDVVFIDDPGRGMSLQPLFNMITGELSADRKGLLPVVKGVKFMFASNWILEAEGNSEAGRQFVTQLDDFYVRWGKQHKDTITPIVDFHGKEFFTDWNDKDWNEFDTFSMHAIQTHLKAESPKATIIGNAMAIRFVQRYEKELFFILANEVVKTAQGLRDGGTIIPQSMLAGLCKEYDPTLSPIRAGRVVREFLHAIGAKDIKVTSFVVSGMTRMGYATSTKVEELQFGEFQKQLKIKTL